MTKYFRYVIQNLEPLRIADDSSSQSGQTVSLKYIPGTAIRGFVINSLAGREDFEKYKKLLFSVHVKYLNAFLHERNIVLEDKVQEEEGFIPSLKGFYEDKTSADKNGKKSIENRVIHDGDTKNHKKASLGHYCAVKDDYIYYYKVESASDMKIKIGKKKEQKVFRNEYLKAGYQFEGYIALDDANCDDKMKPMLAKLPEILGEIFNGKIYLGNGRSQGLGKCVVNNAGMDTKKAFPYEEYSAKSAQEEVYMMLLSNTVMRNKYGKYCGLDLEWLQKKLNVENLRIKYCSTSTVEVKGYNRAWGSKIPSVIMYEQGSVFHLTFDGTASKETLQELMHIGIGVRKNEGFGRILFLDSDKYKNIKYKIGHTTQEAIPVAALDADTKLDLLQNQQVLKMAAKKYYKFLLTEGMQTKILSGVNATKIPNSQVGTVRALLEKYQYRVEEGVEEMKRYFEHAHTKEENQRSHNTQKSIEPFMKRILDCLNASVDALAGMEHPQEIMGISVDESAEGKEDGLLTKQEQLQMKFQYLLDLIRYENREGVQ